MDKSRPLDSPMVGHSLEVNKDLFYSNEENEKIT